MAGLFDARPLRDPACSIATLQALLGSYFCADPWPFEYDKPDGRPVTVTVTTSPSASETVMPNAAIVSPCSYVFDPGTEISGATLVCARVSTGQNETAATARTVTAARARQVPGRPFATGSPDARRTSVRCRGRRAPGRNLRRMPARDASDRPAGRVLRSRTVSCNNVGSIRTSLRGRVAATRRGGNGPRSRQEPDHFLPMRCNWLFFRDLHHARTVTTAPVAPAATCDGRRAR